MCIHVYLNGISNSTCQQAELKYQIEQDPDRSIQGKSSIANIITLNSTDSASYSNFTNGKQTLG